MAEIEKPRRSCNRHDDCNAADEDARKRDRCVSGARSTATTRGARNASATE